MSDVWNRHKKANCGLLLLAAVYCSGAQAAPVAVLDAGNVLIGINGIEVAGYGTWDVSFNDVWQGDVHDVSFAQNATTSIHDIFSPGGFLSGSGYDIAPFHTIAGCNTSNHCDIFTVYDSAHATDLIPYVSGYFWRNFAGNYAAAESPETATVYMQGIQSPGSTPAVIHASWDNSQYVSTVPVPAAAWLFGSGVMGFAGFARRKQA